MPRPSSNPDPLMQPPSFVRRWLVNPIKRLFDGIWHVLAYIVGAVVIGGLLVNVLISFLTTGAPGVTDPRTWAVSRALFAQPTYSTAGVGVVAIFALCSLVAHRASHGPVAPMPPGLLDTFHLMPAHSPAPSADLIPSYKQAYLPRQTRDTHADADEVARVALHEAVTRSDPRSPNGNFGICVFGRKMLGTSRLTWQAIKYERELNKWVLVEWPEDPRQYGDLISELGSRGGKAVLWLENLSHFVTTPRYRVINDLPFALQEARVPFVIVATCQEGGDEKSARKAFGDLMGHLTPIRLGDLPRKEAIELVAELSKEGASVSLDDDFDGTPGSIILAVTRMRDDVYPGLPNDAKHILQALKLLRSVGIRDYALPRVISTAHSLFAPSRSDWGSALQALTKADFLRTTEINASGVMSIAPAADVYLDVAVADYPAPGMTLSADWPRLEQSLQESRDGKALARLGETFRKQGDGVYAETCYRSALLDLTKEQAQQDWALAQFGLGSVLEARSDEIAEAQRTSLLAEAEQALNSALEVISRESDPTLWGEASSALAAVIRQEARTTRGPRQRSDMLDNAAARCREALRFLRRESSPEEWADAQHTLGLILYTHAQLAGLSRDRLSMANSAIEAQRRARSVFSADTHPIKLAKVERALGDACKLRADSARRPLKDELLKQASEAYSDAIGISTTRQIWPADELASINSNLGACLRALALLPENERRTEQLARAADALRTASLQLTQQATPVPHAEVLRDLGVVLSEEASGADETVRLKLVADGLDALKEAVQILGRFGTRELHDQISLGQARLYLQRASWSSPVMSEDLTQARDGAQMALRTMTQGDHPGEYAEARRVIRSAEQRAKELGIALAPSALAPANPPPARNRREAS